MLRKTLILTAFAAALAFAANPALADGDKSGNHSEASHSDASHSDAGHSDATHAEADHSGSAQTSEAHGAKSDPSNDSCKSDQKAC